MIIPHKIDRYEELRRPFLAGVFMISCSILIFQIVQTRILSVTTWYHLAFFAISVAMLGMTIGAVIVYTRAERFRNERLASTLSNNSLATAGTMLISVVVQFTLITGLTPTLTTLVSWVLLLTIMTVPYVFAGIVVSLSLTRSPFPVNQVYGVDLLGAALGCVGVVVVLNFLDGPSTMILAAAIASLAAIFFSRGAISPVELANLPSRAWLLRPLPIFICLSLLTIANGLVPFGIRPIFVKGLMETSLLHRFEKWNSYSRIVATEPHETAPHLWGPSPKMPNDLSTTAAYVNIDGAAGTDMFRYGDSDHPLEFLRYDLVNLAYNLPDIHKSAVIGVGGGRDVMSAHLFGVPDITVVELNPIFIDLLTRHPLYSRFSNFDAIPNVHLNVDDARSWFASTKDKFNLVQMSMIDTWAATGAGAFSLSENGLYTLEGWRAFLKTLTDDGILTVSRWYNPNDLNETGRMISLATAAVLDTGAKDARPNLFVAHANNIATLVLSRRPFTPAQVQLLRAETERLGFTILVAPDQPPHLPLLRSIVSATDIAGVNAVAGPAWLDLTVPTDSRPFFFNELKLQNLPVAIARFYTEGKAPGGVFGGNLKATVTLVLILAISIVGVILTILVPLLSTARNSSGLFVVVGSSYFSLIGMGFMMAEIAILQYFSVYLGHPIYSLGVCLFSLVLATGLGSLSSGLIDIATPRTMPIWGFVTGGYLLVMQYGITHLFEFTASEPRWVRILISLLVVMPLGYLLGFAFPTGMRMAAKVDAAASAWFWGINGATGVLASVLAVLVSMAFGINVTMTLAGSCYLILIPVGLALSRMGSKRQVPPLEAVAQTV